MQTNNLELLGHLCIPYTLNYLHYITYQLDDMIDGAVSGPWSEIARFDIMHVSGGVAASEERDADGAQAQAAQDTYALVMARVLQVSSQGYRIHWSTLAPPRRELHNARVRSARIPLSCAPT